MRGKFALARPSRRRPSVRLWGIALGMSLFGASFVVAGEAHAQTGASQVEGQICVMKRDRTGGKLGFVVLRKAAARFKAAGFSEVPCPEQASLPPQRTPRICQHLRSLNQRSQDVILELYGLTVDEMCDDVDQWVAAAQGEG